MKELREAEGSVHPGFPILHEWHPLQHHWRSKEERLLDPEEDGSGTHTGCHLQSGTGKDKASVGGRELVTRVEKQKGTISVKRALPISPCSRRSLPMFLRMLEIQYNFITPYHL